MERKAHLCRINLSSFSLGSGDSREIPSTGFDDVGGFEVHMARRHLELKFLKVSANSDKKQGVYKHFGEFTA